MRLESKERYKCCQCPYVGDSYWAEVECQNKCKDDEYCEKEEFDNSFEKDE